ncbi:FAD-binding oxidoreductase [Mucisphaera calidilacus]|uniref:4-cresol dehydrogenase [hydroxylating] flavoprotein subunit n=1 Tax=Mucisphaera calidilacus TaxID=2527982 RepID=A0A518BTM2_9BACT|nr:FAD-binding oxidoreductase [Mucisphaera calidilacus]QDU70318.1 4-cresol dehydrogenase [hydroxylating] flavoprotein subunit [Mucisphaera calidilacus]
MCAQIADTQKFLGRVARILPDDRIDATETTRQRYGRSTFGNPRVPDAILYPVTTDEVAGIVKAANDTNTAVHAISRGKNWGYGDAGPVERGQVILDLSRMNQVLELNRELAYAVIQPGVSQGQLSQHLAEHAPDLWVDATGAGVDASLVGNTLDHGFGHTRYGDHFLSCCGMEVVLPDGRVIHTGYGHYPNAKSDKVYPYGVGPMLDGLFVQSNMGIVTRINIWLMPKPEDFCSFVFMGHNDHDLEDIVNRLAPLRMQGLLQSAIHIGNDLRIMSARMRYPFDQTQGITPLPEDVRADIRKQGMIGMWNGCGSVSGTKGTVRAVRKELARVLKPYNVRFINDQRLALAERIQKGLAMVGAGGWLGEMLGIFKPVYGLLKGEPSNEHIRGAAWRVRDPEPELPADPLDVHAGIAWLSPVVPNRGEDARQLMNLMEPVYQKHGFDSLVTFTMITERAMICITNISFDKRIPEECQRAQDCYEELMKILMESGFIPYRSGPTGYAKLRLEGDPFWDVVNSIKQTLDPNDTISPGRYVAPLDDKPSTQHRLAG